MSITLTLKGDSSELSCDIFPPLEVEHASQLCLLSLYTSNSIPNIDPLCYKIAFNSTPANCHTVEIPTGTYELESLESSIRKLLPSSVRFVLKADVNTLQCMMQSSAEIDFTVENNISKLLGFDSKKYEPKTIHVSRNIVNIMRVNSIKIECNLTTGSFNNGIPDQTIHEFSPSVPPGYKISEAPLHPVYYPLVRSCISKVDVALKDQDDNLINLRGEPITIRLQIVPSHGAQI